MTDIREVFADLIRAKLPFSDELLQRFSMINKLAVDELIAKANASIDEKALALNIPIDRTPVAVVQLTEFCESFIIFIAEELLPYEFNNIDSSTFLIKCMADYTRYVAQHHTNANIRASWRHNALRYYSAGYQYAQQHLDPTNHHRLSIALNYAIFVARLQMDPALALEIASEAFEDAVPGCPEFAQGVGVDSPRSTPTLKVLRMLDRSIRFWAEHICVSV